ncbi:MAG: hypothetical protein J7K26_02010 [Candidatus Aenigmarchaeota archaeon]|nr:hypothetical protein [Candidatus Aenigmarchaeota archaeon]
MDIPYVVPLYMLRHYRSHNLSEVISTRYRIGKLYVDYNNNLLFNEKRILYKNHFTSMLQEKIMKNDYKAAKIAPIRILKSFANKHSGKIHYNDLDIRINDKPICLDNHVRMPEFFYNNRQVWSINNSLWRSYYNKKNPYRSLTKILEQSNDDKTALAIIIDNDLQKD